MWSEVRRSIVASHEWGRWRHFAEVLPNNNMDFTPIVGSTTSWPWDTADWMNVRTETVSAGRRREIESNAIQFDLAVLG